ncbi:bilirubin oxidase [Thermincola ferriacetica]|uniref:Bilirubin oxidase n=1 Tax=Thermincola ferriacetica TaxID=281456 RepID=A0A0L6W4I5_9FIRM|nr:multicopper oxidase [Thermincola ferriacetica]KNZ70386.1 bilirubin oxidase [Thermincola ferriacetica]
MSLEKFVDPLPIPGILKPVGKLNGVDFYRVAMREFKQKLHRDLPETTVWGYEGTYPGPTFEVRKNVPIKVKWENNLPVNRHLLPVDSTVHGAQPSNPLVRTVVHLHGGNVPDESDGYPEAWFTNGFKQTGPFFTQKIYDYPNAQPATTLWYHDHALGITRLNVYAGLAGFYLIRDDCEDQLNLPKGNFEIPLVIQDRSFNPDGSLFYPRQPDPPPEGFPPGFPDPSIVPEFFGDTILVNGKVWPFLEVEPRKYRFRLLNGSNSRFYRMKLTSGQPFIQIGTDQGFLKKPVITNEITLGPGERADVVLDFTAFTGQNIILTNDAPSPFPNGDPVDPNTDPVGQLMQFRVNLPLSEPDTSIVPSRLCSLPRLKEEMAGVVRDQTLVESADEFGRLLLLLEGLRWSDPITDEPELGNIEIWRLINTTPDTHPIHLHLVRFLILDRQPFDVKRFQETGEIVFTGPAEPPDPTERGWKDTVRANPGEVTRIIIRFASFTGIFPWHCHILEHEDNEMMRPYEVVAEEEE